MSGRKATNSTKQGRGMLRSKGQKFTADLIKLEAKLMRMIEAEKDPDMRLSLMRLAKDTIAEAMPYIYPKLQAIAHGTDNEIAEELLKAIRDIGDTAPDQEGERKV